MVYESMSINQVTGDSTFLYVGLAVILVLFGFVFFVLALSNYKHRSNSLTWYKDQVLAFKAGYIKKTADEKGIEMVYPPKADLMTNLEEEVSGDLNTP